MFVNRFARLARLLPAIPVIRPDWRSQPVYVADLGRAIAQAAADPPTHAGKTYALGGPQILTMLELVTWIAAATGRGGKPIIALPDALAGPMARLTGWAPFAPVTWDQWLMLGQDNIVSGAPGFEAFGITPAALSVVAPAWLASWRRHGRWAETA